MVLVTCAALAILFSLSTREVLSSTQSRLERRVQDSADDVWLRNGELQLDSDFYSVTQDVYLSLYDEDMYFLYGRIPYGFDSQPDFADGQVRSITEGNTEWYVYDMSFRLTEDYTVYIRGITSVTDAEASFTVTIRFALILLPALVVATAFIGYRFTRRTLMPVKKITDTVRKIRTDADLSQRIGITGGGRTRGDEIYTLADTFDEMLSELEEAFQREKQFTSDVSHELRTPVSVILAQCSACLEDETLSAKQREQIMLIQKKARDMSDIISHLLFLSRADQGRQPLNKEYLNLSELTGIAAEEQQLLAECGLETYYWASGKSGSEIDFLIQNEMSIVPIEVKAEVNLQAKSLKFYCLKFRPPVAIRTSMGKYYKQTISFSETSDVHASEGYTLIDLPLYAISRIQQECAMISDK